MTTFLKNQDLIRGEACFRVVRPMGDSVQLENVITGELSVHALDALLEEYRRGFLRTSNEQYKPKSAPVHSSTPPDMGHLSSASRTETLRRINYIVELKNKGAFGGSQAILRAAIADVADKLRDPFPPHYTTVYRWLRRHVTATLDLRSLFSRLAQRGGPGQSRLQPEVEAIIHDKIDAIYLARKVCSAEDIHNAVFLELQKENTTRIESEWLKVPGLRTIQRRVQSISAYDKAIAKFGHKEAERQFSIQGVARRATRILEIVEIDHTPLDIFVVGEDGAAIGRPEITIVLDRFSRCVLGFSISLAGHGKHAVLEAIRHSLLPKSYLANRYPELNLMWECYGWFEKLVMDNGLEFHSHTVVGSLLDLGIIAEYAASRDPNDKPFVERFLRTLNYSFIHKLPGTTLSKIHQRKGFKAEDDACVTFEKLTEMIHVWILSVYHTRPHHGLGGRAPIDVWKESSQAYPPQLKRNADDLNIALSEVCNSALQHYGIDLNDFRYVSQELLLLRRMLPAKERVDVKWPSYDVGYIWVWNRLENTYIKAFNTDESYAGLTLEQAKAVKAALASSDDYQHVRANAKDILNEEVDKALKAKDLKSRKRGARMANKTARDSNTDPGKDAPESDHQDVPESADQDAPMKSEEELEPFDMESIDPRGGA